MNVDTWLESACADADRRGVPELKPLLTTLAQATRALRAADWNDNAGTGPASAPDLDVPGEEDRRADHARR